MAIVRLFNVFISLAKNWLSEILKKKPYTYEIRRFKTPIHNKKKNKKNGRKKYKAVTFYGAIKSFILTCPRANREIKKDHARPVRLYSLLRPRRDMYNTRINNNNNNTKLRKGRV